ncbi:pyridoxamine 5'-phosphate oxidase family protein [Paenibacillus pini]|uniref:Pyridoxamine 5 '-phosphate-related protein n=1 Tax=Paenibacillus pini JCM 16418 TaxID=1236976 RepID=W7YCN1_9BACL|nr:pyridoxamine 5'-phosphate oxidase family protein [Paenibacillus pini]GAF08660.1 pyridoxamine 5 '-phosphate-related protein [Paenibacillus pini JCM 16418]
MRRSEFSIEEEQEIEQFLSTMTFGFLGTVGEDGRPRVTPLNFVYTNGLFYFHGSRIGEKMEHLKHNPIVSFSVADEYAIIPSYFTDPHMACPATAFFKSVTVSGTAEVVKDIEEKASSFSFFMKKLQPEGGYDPIDAENPKYRSRLNGVAVVKITPDHMSTKFKFGQNLTESKRNDVLNGLTQRSSDRDQETAEMIRGLACPHMESKSKNE